LAVVVTCGTLRMTETVSDNLVKVVVSPNDTTTEESGNGSNRMLAVTANEVRATTGDGTTGDGNTATAASSTDGDNRTLAVIADEVRAALRAKKQAAKSATKELVRIGHLLKEAKDGGIGFWFLGNAEFCIVGKREGGPSIRAGRLSLVIEPKQEHSVKPDSIHRLCEERFPGPHLEIFWRLEREGWTVLGDEAPDDGHGISETIDLLRGHSPQAS
jgi:hypothetical protein